MLTCFKRNNYRIINTESKLTLPERRMVGGMGEAGERD